MLIKCPQCHTAYRIENQSLPPTGLRMRCAKCRHIWREFSEPEKGTILKDITQKSAATATTPSTTENCFLQPAATAEKMVREKPHKNIPEENLLPIKSTAIPHTTPQTANSSRVESVVENTTTKFSSNSSVLQQDATTKFSSANSAPEHTAATKLLSVDPVPEEGEIDILTLDTSAFRFAFSREDHIVKEPINTMPPISHRGSRMALLLLFLLIALTGAMYFFRQPITEIFPQTAFIYEKLDRLYSQSAPKPQISSLIWGYEDQNGHPAIRLRGEIINPSQELLTIPSLNISLYGRDGNLLRAITVIPTEHLIASGDQIKFQTVFAAPAQEIRQIYATFEE